MKIAVLGTGDVGRTLATKLATLGHEVTMASRTSDNPKALAWAEALGGAAGSFAEAAAGAELIINATKGSVSLQALEAAGAENLAGKIVLDVSNPLDFSQGFPPTLTVANTDSLGEQLQRAFPEARVVKALNTVANPIMVDPSLIPGEHVLFVCGDDPEARAQVSAWLREWFGWEQLIDLGGIQAARATEAWLLLWTRLYGALGTPMFNLTLSRAEEA
ncbi:MAG: NAD(P)-binding domain-containing protein [Alphaproteobacteria bacterium]|nr:NAD(P)-binding domain-containing protein [Alphaproteobacteria bacterium]